MPIPFRSILSSAVANATFLDKSGIGDLFEGILGMRKDASDPTAITDVQDFINELAGIDGVVGESDPNKFTYTSEEIIANGDDRKAAIGKLDAQVFINLNINNLQQVQITQNTRATYPNEVIADTAEITKDNSIYNQVRRVSGDAAATTAALAPFGDSSTTLDGIVIVLRGTDSTNTLTITSQDIQYGCILNGDATLENYYELELMYDAAAERYIEQRRNF